MVKTFGALVYSLPWEKVQMFMDCMDIENRIAKIEADKPAKKKAPTLHR